MNGSALVDRYLADLASTAATLPSARRAELLDEVREHIATLFALMVVFLLPATTVVLA